MARNKKKKKGNGVTSYPRKDTTTATPDARRMCRVKVHTSMIAEQIHFYGKAVVVDVIKDSEWWDNGSLWLLIQSPLLEPVPYGHKIPQMEVVMNAETQIIRFITQEKMMEEMQAAEKALAELKEREKKEKEDATKPT